MSRRLLKAAEAIRAVVSMAILTELRDPRVKNVTVVGVEVLQADEIDESLVDEDEDVGTEEKVVAEEDEEEFEDEPAEDLKDEDEDVLLEDASELGDDDVE